jgi:Mg-chelatase subunit ChlD
MTERGTMKNALAGIVIVCGIVVALSMVALCQPESTQPAGPTTCPATQPDKREFSRKVGDDADTQKTVGIFGVATSQAAGNSGFGPLGGGNGPRAASAPARAAGKVHHIVYVIDRSGSMAESMDYLKDALVGSIGHLSEVQDFHIILLGEKEPIEFTPKQLTVATVENKVAADKFIDDIKAKGKTDPIPAIKRAFEVMDKAGDKPGKVIYLLTGGDFPDNDAVAKAIRDLGANKKVMVNTFLYAPTEEKSPKEMMEKIAKENGGNYKFVSTKEAK